MSPYGEDNEEEGADNGFPAWHTINLATQYQVTKNIQFRLALENITDNHYKNFASAISSPGRNLIIGLNGNF